MSYNRLFSLIIALSYIVISSIITKKYEEILYILVFLIIPMTCIWFGDDLGSITNIRLGGIRPTINQKSPGCLIKFAGWILLLVPIWIFILNMIGFT